jgi:hypothetical protein
VLRHARQAEHPFCIAQLYDTYELQFLMTAVAASIHGFVSAARPLSLGPRRLICK